VVLFLYNYLKLLIFLFFTDDTGRGRGCGLFFADNQYIFFAFIVNIIPPRGIHENGITD